MRKDAEDVKQWVAPPKAASSVTCKMLTNIGVAYRNWQFATISDLFYCQSTTTVQNASYEGAAKRAQ